MSSRSRASSPSWRSDSTARGGRPSSASSTWWRQRVTSIGGPTGRQPCATRVSISTAPRKATPTAPPSCTSSPRRSRPCPGPRPALASPPMIGAPPRTRSRAATACSASMVNGSASRRTARRCPAGLASSGRGPPSSRRASRSTPGSEAAVSERAGPASASSAPPITPEAAQPTSRASGNWSPRPARPGACSRQHAQERRRPAGGRPAARRAAGGGAPPPPGTRRRWRPAWRLPKPSAWPRTIRRLCRAHGPARRRPNRHGAPPARPAPRRPG